MFQGQHRPDQAHLRIEIPDGMDSLHTGDGGSVEKMHEQRLKLVIGMVRSCKITKTCSVACCCQGFVAKGACCILDAPAPLCCQLCNSLLAQIEYLKIHRKLSAVLLVQLQFPLQFLLIPELMIHIQRKQRPTGRSRFQGSQQGKGVTTTTEGDSNPCIGGNSVLQEK